ncbi:MAG: NAD(P)-dependent oxidoreductase [Pseudomonadota bacterium]|uniref:NAD(P)-dependent oxidoreductase n=1 Tax=Roseovarius TaxID=74030 RepID=UPI0022A7DE9E|nr:NAD(P)-dependent oxidoreductase [Roseovarius sp. EGI FJ00037]MCZ0811640.1 NAD(P)-dependent oxidoreductase [Roseovarius sp. EGI FJ00037]
MTHPAPIPDVPAHTVAFIGLGTMGSGMAARLVAAGHDVRGHDIDPDRLQTFAAIGGQPCASVAEACAGAQIIMTILPRDEHVKTVCLGPGGIAESAAKGALLLEMSTILPDTSIALHDALTEAGLRVLDAPVGRTPKDAAQGTLLVMVGGSRADFDAAQPVILPISDKAVHLGPKGSGIRMKIVNNYMAMVGMVMTAETLAMARRAGIDSMAATDVLQNTTAGRGQINVNFPAKVLSGDTTPDFPLSMGEKDISLGLALAQQLGVPLSLGAPARDLFARAGPMKMGDLDCTAMLLLIEELAEAAPGPDPEEDKP